MIYSVQAMFLACPVTVVTMFLIAYIVHAVFHWNLLCALTLAACLGATDPVKSSDALFDFMNMKNIKFL